MESATKKTRVCLLGDGFGLLHPYFSRAKRTVLVAQEQDATTEQMIVGSKCDVVIQTGPNFPEDVAAHRAAPIKIIDSAYAAYVFDEEIVANVLNQFGDDQRALRLERFHIPTELKKKVEVAYKTVESAKQRSAYWAGFTCTLLLMLTMTMSSMYPALDVVTGERERGTLILLLMAPGERRNLVIAKLLTVSIVTMAAGVLSLISVCLTLVLLVPQTFDMAGSFNLSLPIGDLLLSSIFMFPTAIAISASAILISSYARTFQQGQSYFVPLMLGGLVLSGIALALDETAPFFIYFVPLANLMLCMHKAIQGQWNAAAIIATSISSFIYIALLLQVSVGILDREESLFGIKPPPWKQTTHAKEAFVLFGACIGGFFYLSGLLQGLSPLWGNLFAQILTFALPAILVPKFLKMPLAQTLSLKRPSGWYLLGAVLMAPGMALLASLVATMQAGIMPDAENYIKMLQDMVIPKGENAWIAYITIALGPGTCEELMFRGALQGMLRKSFSKPMLCAIVAVLFGILHGSSARFLPTAIMGFVLCVVTEFSGSIFPSMLMHCCNNAFAVYEQTHPAEASTVLICLAIASTFAGAGAFYYGKRQEMKVQQAAKPQENVEL